MQLTPAKYQDIRKNIKTGDIILWKGRSLISRLIMLFTRFSHASLVVRLDIGDLQDRVFIVEALPEGLSLRFLSNKLKNYSGDAYLFQLEPQIPEWKQHLIMENSIEDLAKGIGYDFKGLLANIFGRVHPDAKQYFCSEFVYSALRKAWIYPKGPYNKALKAPRPGDFPKWYDGSLVKIIP